MKDVTLVELEFFGEQTRPFPQPERRFCERPMLGGQGREFIFEGSAHPLERVAACRGPLQT